MLYCPRCDKRIEPDHRCLSRRWFLGMLGAAVVAPVLPKVEAVTAWKVQLVLDEETEAMIAAMEQGLEQGLETLISSAVWTLGK